jgi:hypothetical protein
MTADQRRAFEMRDSLRDMKTGALVDANLRRTALEGAGRFLAGPRRGAVLSLASKLKTQWISSLTPAGSSEVKPQPRNLRSVG